MAKIGLKYPVYAPYSESGETVSYGVGAVVAKAVNATVNITSNDAKFFADDGLAETDKSFSEGSISFEGDDLTDAMRVALLAYTEGNVVDSAIGSKELSANGSGLQPYVGFGFYGKVVRNNVPYFRAIWLKKVQFSEPNDELSTKGQNVEFKSVTIEGTVMLAADGKGKEEALRSTEAKAKAWLDGKCGLANKALPVASSVASGTYTTAQSATLTCATPSAVIKYTTDGTIPTATHGTTYSAAIACAKPSNTCIKAIATKSGFANSDVLELYIIVE